MIIGPGGRSDVAGFETVAENLSPQDAAFIVRCVNSHAALVDALSHAHATLDCIARRIANENDPIETADLLSSSATEASEMMVEIETVMGRIST